MRQRTLMPMGITFTLISPLAGACGLPLIQTRASARVPEKCMLQYLLYASVFRVGSEATTIPPSGSFLAETTRLHPESQIETNHYSDDYNRLIPTLTFMSM